jgi:bifunctional DNA-binding transcriptional regulator/antitoxin component of YhaV-PrlF toxin-antitoxin module
MTHRVGRKAQAVIPKQMRDEVGIEPATRSAAGVTGTTSHWPLQTPSTASRSLPGFGPHRRTRRRPLAQGLRLTVVLDSWAVLPVETPRRTVVAGRLLLIHAIDPDCTMTKSTQSETAVSATVTWVKPGYGRSPVCSPEPVPERPTGVVPRFENPQTGRPRRRVGGDRLPPHRPER